jgi:DNA primase
MYISPARGVHKMNQQHVLEHIKERIDIVELIGKSVELRRSGRSFVGFCPFHANSRTPAFNVYADTQSYHCFGCKASGTIFDFVMQREGVSFRESLEYLAQQAGITIQERTSEDVVLDQQRTRILEAQSAAAVFFHHMLVRSQRGEEARGYIERRNLHEETITTFQLGYAPDDWQLLTSYLRDRRGFTDDELELAGLGIRHETRGIYDRFRHRLMFPIRNIRGEVVAFGGRSLDNTQPKYLNSPQTPVFDKGKTLYGIDLARSAIASSRAVIIVEGYVDVITAHQHGFRNVVAPLGTALTSEHAAALRRMASVIYLALDADAAGIRATLRGAQTLQGDGAAVPIATPHGITEWQRKDALDVRIIELPAGRDPDEVIHRDPDEWRQLIDRARPAMDFYLNALTADLDIRSAQGKRQAVERLGPILGQIVNAVERAHYVQQLARLIEVDEPLILRALHQPARRTTDPAPRTTDPAPPSDAYRAPTGVPPQEAMLLGLLLRHPGACDTIEAKLRGDLREYARLATVVGDSVLGLLSHPEWRAIWQARRAQPDADLASWLAALDPALATPAQTILAQHIPQPQAYRYVHDALECATILQLHQAKRWNLRLIDRLTTIDDDDERLRLHDAVSDLCQYINSLSTPRRNATFADLHSLHSV